MSYSKPELVGLGTSVQEIQGSPISKGVITYPETRSPTTEYDATIGAYEADE